MLDPQTNGDTPMPPWSPMAAMAELARQEGLGAAVESAAVESVAAAPDAPPPLPRKRGAKQLLQETFMAMKAMSRREVEPPHLRLRSDESVLFAAMKRQRPWYVHLPTAALDLIQAQRPRLTRARVAVLALIDAMIRRSRGGSAEVAETESELVLDQDDSRALFAVMVGGFILGIAVWMLAGGGKAVEALPAAPAIIEASMPAVATPAADAVAPLSALEKLTVGVIDDGQRIQGTSRTLAVRAVLLAAPTPHALRVGDLPAHSVVSIFPAFAAPRGWVMAQRPDGAVGFISTLQLAGQRDPAILAVRGRR